ncbi:MAG: ATP-binding protein, partial [Candidatus Manganitrophaceae bacterium]
VGIPPEALSKIFEVFYQVDGMEKPKGSGLGLAIVRDLAHLLKGKIEVDSEYGKGSTFTLFLPYRFSS